jgi:hypothetical protein
MVQNFVSGIFHLEGIAHEIFGTLSTLGKCLKILSEAFSTWGE